MVYSNRGKVLRGRRTVLCENRSGGKILSGMEIQIWTSLLWAICEESEIYERVQGLMKLAFGVEERREADREEFRYCFRRLENRGLFAPVKEKLQRKQP